MNRKVRMALLFCVGVGLLAVSSHGVRKAPAGGEQDSPPGKTTTPAAPVRSAAPAKSPPGADVRTVRGTSLQGVVEPGTKVQVLRGYYDDHPLQRGDLVIYRHAGRESAIIKMIKAIPGDAFAMKERKGGWGIEVNGELLLDVKNQPYLINARGRKMLALYERDYKGKIPPRACLLLGTVAGTFDATRFGLVDLGDIVGKAVPLPKPRSE